MAMNSMRIFGTYNTYSVIATASSAYLISIIINYFMGKIFYNILSGKESDQPVTYPRIIEFRKFRYLLAFAALSAIPFFGKFVILFSGFCQINLLRIISFGIITKVIFYSWFMLS
jgi:membrane protein YqaA with SNARE-associated domain